MNDWNKEQSDQFLANLTSDGLAPLVPVYGAIFAFPAIEFDLITPTQNWEGPIAEINRLSWDEADKIRKLAAVMKIPVSVSYETQFKHASVTLGSGIREHQKVFWDVVRTAIGRLDGERNLNVWFNDRHLTDGMYGTITLSRSSTYKATATSWGFSCPGG